MLDVLRGQTFVLVNSRPRTASKFALGVMVAAWGAASGRRFLPLWPAPVQHIHGLATASADPRKARWNRKTVRLFRWSGRRLAITILRDNADRCASNLRFRNHTVTEPMLAKALAKEESDDAWLVAHVYTPLDWPPAPPVGDWLIASHGRTTCLLIRIEALDAFLGAHLFSQKPEAEIEARGRRIGFPYGLHFRNAGARGEVVGRGWRRSLKNGLLGGRL
jgi:hypothetical protein